MQYGEVLRWQIRAQNAADAAASASLSAQTQTWIQQLALLYAASVEEWRIRHLLSGLQAAQQVANPPLLHRRGVEQRELLVPSLRLRRERRGRGGVGRVLRANLPAQHFTVLHRRGSRPRVRGDAERPDRECLAARARGQEHPGVFPSGLSGNEPIAVEPMVYPDGIAMSQPFTVAMQFCAGSRTDPVAFPFGHAIAFSLAAIVAKTCWWIDIASYTAPGPIPFCGAFQLLPSRYSANPDAHSGAPGSQPWLGPSGWQW